MRIALKGLHFCLSQKQNHTIMALSNANDGIIAARMFYYIPRSNANHFFYNFYSICVYTGMQSSQSALRNTAFSVLFAYYLRMSLDTTKIIVKNYEKHYIDSNQRGLYTHFMCKKAYGFVLSSNLHTFVHKLAMTFGTLYD